MGGARKDGDGGGSLYGNRGWRKHERDGRRGSKVPDRLRTVVSRNVLYHRYKSSVGCLWGAFGVLRLFPNISLFCSQFSSVYVVLSWFVSNTLFVTSPPGEARHFIFLCFGIVFCLLICSFICLHPSFFPFSFSFSFLFSCSRSWIASRVGRACHIRHWIVSSAYCIAV